MLSDHGPSQVLDMLPPSIDHVYLFFSLQETVNCNKNWQGQTRNEWLAS